MVKPIGCKFAIVEYWIKTIPIIDFANKVLVQILDRVQILGPPYPKPMLVDVQISHLSINNKEIKVILH